MCIICFFCVFRESLIRTAFQCLQLVVTDFLPTMPCSCLQIVVDVAGSFGLHNQELNISLTSIGLLVSIIAFLMIPFLNDSYAVSSEYLEVWSGLSLEIFTDF